TGGSGKSLGVIGALGLLALVVWAIVPPWRSVLPRFVRPGVVAVRDLPGIRHARALLGGYERWRSFHRPTGLFVAIAFVHGILDAVSRGCPRLATSSVLDRQPAQLRRPAVHGEGTGDDTTAMRESVQPGMPAVIGGPFGRFSHGKGGDHQVWIAGGGGIGPFLTWLRALDDEPGPNRIDFF